MLTPSKRTSNRPDVALQEKLLAGLATVMGLLGVFFGIAHAVSDDGLVAAAVNLAAGLYSFSMLVQRRLGVSHRSCVYQFIGVLTLTAGTASYLSGGIQSPAMAWMAVIPVFGLAMDRPRTAVIGATLVAIAVVTIAALTIAGFTLPIKLPSPLREVMAGVLLIVLTSSVLTVGVLSERMRQRIHADLQSTNLILQDEVNGHNETRDRLQRTHRELVDAAHVAGAAEVATGVLHNLGNALTAVNVSASLTEARVAGMRIDRVKRLAEALPGSEYETVRRYIGGVFDDLQRSRTEMRSELDSLRTGVDHAIATVTAQQRHAQGSGILQAIELQEMLADALLLSTHRHVASTHVSLDCRRVPRLVLDRHRLVQIVTNLVGNAHDAIRTTDRAGRIDVVGRLHDGDVLELSVTDNGIGIAADDLDRVFAHGFTTKEDGHGFGLHACALSAAEVGGSLRVSSAGPGRGATFILRLPVERARVNLTSNG